MNINNFLAHLRDHHFVNTPHKHDFYMVVFFTEGSGNHQIDFVNYKIKPGSVFFLSPGQSHSWQLSSDINGFVFFHSQQFYQQIFTSLKATHFPFFASIYATPVLNLKNKFQKKITPIFEELLQEYQENNIMKLNKISALITLIYIELSRWYVPKEIPLVLNQNYLSKLHAVEAIIEANYSTIKSPKEYAAKMNMSEKHLNRICKTCLNKTTTQIIADRIIIEAKRALVINNNSITETAAMLGFFDSAYFSRFFKKHTNETPAEFAKKLK
jgi:AraC-like DNA-binding protein